jgi:hypothetical protein
MKKWMFIFILFLMVQCRDAYNVTPATNGNGSLVVEGFVNANGITRINLSRTTRLSDKRIAPEIGAIMVIESSGGDVFLMHELGGGGIYESDNVTLDPAQKYRLRIQTLSNKEYASDFRNYVATPVIDSITWEQDVTGVNIFAHAHDNANSTRYYKLDYEETWEFHSAYRASLKFTPIDPGPDSAKYALEYIRPDQLTDPTIFTCYNSRVSTGINIVSTENLATSEVLYRIRSIPAASIELSVLYSMDLKQYALSKEAYEFFVKMKKNTESLGSIFDAQPSELTGNITCVTDAAELVIGFVDVTTLESKRIFISNESLNGWGYDLGCKAFFEPDRNFSDYPYPNNPGLFNHIAGRDIVPTTPAETGPGGSVKKFFANKRVCVDCTMRGTNVKPGFWP